MMRQLIDGVARFRCLPTAERHALARAVTRYGVVMCLLRTIGLKRCLAFTQRALRRKQCPGKIMSSPIDADQCVLAVGRAHNAWGRGACLDRALTLCWLLNRSGMRAEVRLGVRKHDTDLEAHAWVECNGRRLGDDGARSATYAPFEAVTL